MRVVNLLNDERDLDALNGLRDIIKVLDLNDIARLKNSFDALSVAVDIAEIIFNNVDWNQKWKKPKTENLPKEIPIPISITMILMIH